MTIISSGVLAPGLEPGYPKNRRRLEGSRIVRTKTWRVIIHSDDEAEEGESILNQLPAQWQISADQGGGFAIREQSAERDQNNRKKWFIDLTGDDQQSDEEKEDKDKPPDQRRSTWSWDFETMELAFTRDVRLTEDPEDVENFGIVATSAGEPFEVTTPFVIPVVTINKSQANFDPDTIINYVNHTNKSKFWGADPGLALMAGIRDNPGEVYGGKRYRDVNYIVKFRIPIVANAVEGWKLILMDYGNVYFEGGKLKKFLDDRGQPTKGKLNGEGGKLADQEGEPKFLRFTQFNDAEFNDLNINWPLGG